MSSKNMDGMISYIKDTRNKHISKCPFCNSSFTDLLVYGNSFAVHCLYCGAQGPAFKKAAEAVGFWNSIKLNYKIGAIKNDD